jgi:hypothetical protein
MKYKKTFISRLDTILIFIAFVGGVCYFVAKGVENHKENIKQKSSEDNPISLNLSMAFPTLPRFSYDVIAEKDLFQPLYYSSNKPPAISPSSHSIVKSPPLDIKIKTDLAENDFKDIKIIITGVVNDGKRTFILVEDTKTHESKFIALGKSINGFRFVDIKQEYVVFESESSGQKQNITLGKLKNESQLGITNGIARGGDQ